MKRLILAALLTAMSGIANGEIISVTLSENSDASTVGSVRSTSFPTGNAPVTGAACSTWTCANKGDGDGEIDEASATVLDFVASGDLIAEDINYGYQTNPDTGDIQMVGRVPTSVSGYTEAFTAIGMVGIDEGTADADYFFRVWCADTGGVRITHGTPSSHSSIVSNDLTSCLGRYIAATYDQSTTTLTGYESDDGVTYTAVGSVSKTLSCASDCPTYAAMTSGDDAQSTVGSMTALADATTITVTGSPQPSPENIIWSGDFDTCDFTQYPRNNSPNEVVFPAIPRYGQPVQYGNQPTSGPNAVGNGDLLEITSTGGGTCPSTGAVVGSGPVREGTYSARFTIKNSANDNTSSDPAVSDCGTQPFPSCSRRRTQLDFALQAPDYDMFPLDGERWFSFSVYVPDNFDIQADTSTITLFGVKATNGQGSSIFNVSLTEAWNMTHRWDNQGGVPASSYTWQHQMNYSGDGALGLSGCYPRTGSGATYWPDGAAHYPNEAASCAAMQDVTVGTWHDFVYHVILDPTPAGSGGTGILEMWKRTGAGSWVKVLNVTPGSVTRGGLTFDHGIGYNYSGGFGPKLGPYVFGDSANYILTQSTNSDFYLDNIKVGNENATFVDMSPDGSSP